MQEINQAGLDLIKSFEGCKLTAYQDQRGIWTIGYGHTGADVVPGLSITDEIAEDLLKEDISIAQSCVNCWVKVEINNNQYSALVSFTYNVGPGNFKNSTLLKLLNGGHDPSAEFLKWDHVNGTPNVGLLRRRQAEAALFTEPVESV